MSIDKIMEFFGIEFSSNDEKEKCIKIFQKIFIIVAVATGSMFCLGALYIGGNFYILSKYSDNSKKYISLMKKEKNVLEKILFDTSRSTEERASVLCALTYKQIIEDKIIIAKYKDIDQYLVKVRLYNVTTNIRENYQKYKEIEEDYKGLFKLVESEKVKRTNISIH